jgi:hypothetical protein
VTTFRTALVVDVMLPFADMLDVVNVNVAQAVGWVTVGVYLSISIDLGGNMAN